MADTIHHKNDFWLRLDNAAKIYPAITNRELTSVFRASVLLKERVKAGRLLEAVHTLENRFPYYKVKLKPGFFWYYLDSSTDRIPVLPDKGIPCRAFGKNELMFRVLARDNKISVEFSHVLTDGGGAMEFLKSLLIIYLERCGKTVPPELTFLRADELPAEEEYEDAYNKHFKDIRRSKYNVAKAFHLPFQLRTKPRFDVLTAIMPLDKILIEARSFNISLTDYLVSVFLFSLQNIYEQQSNFRKRVSGNVLRIQVPINLRKMFSSHTMRNFSLYVVPEIDLRLGKYTFEEIAKTVYYQMRLETNKKLISKMISRNVGGERKHMVKLLPLFLKSMFLWIIYKRTSKHYSGVLTNMGKIQLEPWLNDHIDRFSFFAPPPNKVMKANCAVTGFDNRLIISFGNTTVSKELERQFLTFFTSRGIPVKLTNSGR